MGTPGVELSIVVRGTEPPGRTFASYGAVHVGVQVGREPFGMVPADSRGSTCSAAAS